MKSANFRCFWCLWCLWVVVGAMTTLLGPYTTAQPLSELSHSDSIVVVIESQQDVFVGRHRDVSIIVNECPATLESMDLAITYDPTVLTLDRVVAVPHRRYSLMNWDSLTFDNPLGIIRISGRMNSEVDLQKARTSDWPRVVATMQFMVGTDANLDCETYPLEFVWIDCDDNTLTLAGDQNPISSYRVIDCYDHIVEPSHEAPSYGGPPLSCASASASAKHARRVDFYNGTVNIVCPGGSPSYGRGDLNLNNIAYEIADVEVYAEYLLGNEDVLLDREACTLVSDINKDGRPWTIYDFAHLMAVVIGDVMPSNCGTEPPTYFKSRCFDWPRQLDPMFPEPIPAPLVLTDTITFAIDAASHAIEMKSDDSVAAVLFTFDGCVGVEVGIEGMDVRHSFDGESTRVLVMPDFLENNNRRVLLVGHTKFDVQGTGRLTAAEAATVHGCPLATVLRRN